MIHPCLDFPVGLDHIWLNRGLLEGVLSMPFTLPQRLVLETNCSCDAILVMFLFSPSNCWDEAILGYELINLAHTLRIHLVIHSSDILQSTHYIPHTGDLETKAVASGHNELSVRMWRLTTGCIEHVLWYPGPCPVMEVSEVWWPWEGTSSKHVFNDKHNTLCSAGSQGFLQVSLLRESWRISGSDCDWGSVVGDGRKGVIPGKRTEARERGIFRKLESGWGWGGTGDWRTEVA